MRPGCWFYAEKKAAHGSVPDAVTEQLVSSHVGSVHLQWLQTFVLRVKFS